MQMLECILQDADCALSSTSAPVLVRSAGDELNAFAVDFLFYVLGVLLRKKLWLVVLEVAGYTDKGGEHISMYRFGGSKPVKLVLEPSEDRLLTEVFRCKCADKSGKLVHENEKVDFSRASAIYVTMDFERSCNVSLEISA